jgi:crotonobetainyl-CoA:carnitine CoA-transferase CaiB-like acyl-CoA transferase
VDRADTYPFRGLRLLDFGVGAVGVEVGRLFAEYGADVIKVESHAKPDFMRALTPAWMNPAFASSSRSKRSFGVNLGSERGVELVHQLARVSDVVVDNNAAGVMERLGLGYEALRAVNPRIVVFTSQMVGGQGPWGGWIGYGPSTHPVSGLQYLWNYPEDAERPAGSVNIFPDHLVGRLGALAAVAALIARERSGRGCKLDAAQFETPINMLGDLFAREALAPGSLRPAGNRSPRGAPWGVYRCAGPDEWCAINVRSDAEWQALAGALGSPEWCQRPEYRTANGRLAQQDELDARLGEWTQTRTPQEVARVLQEAGVPAGDVQHAAHQLADPQLAARGYARVVDQPGVGGMVFEGPSFRGTDLPDPIVLPAPLLGEHTRPVARELLGLAEAEIDALVAAGVLEETRPFAGAPAAPSR